MTTSIPTSVVGSLFLAEDYKWMSRDDHRRWLSLRSAVSLDLKELERSGVLHSKRGDGRGQGQRGGMKMTNLESSAYWVYIHNFSVNFSEVSVSHINVLITLGRSDTTVWGLRLWPLTPLPP